MLWPFVESEVTAYYIGQSFFEFVILAVFSTYIKDTFLKSLIQFFTGLALYSLIKEFYEPTKLDFNEYLGLFVGMLFFAIQFTYGTLKRTAK